MIAPKKKPTVRTSYSCSMSLVSSCTFVAASLMNVDRETVDLDRTSRELTR